MKKILSILFLYLLSIGTSLGQYNISYGVSIPTGCEDGNPLIFIASGSGFEGDIIKIPSYTIPDKYLQLGDYVKQLQLIANAFADAEISVPKGALKENISLDIDLTVAKCGSGFENLKELLSLTVTVIGENTGGHKPFQYYNFENGKEAYIKFNTKNLMPLLEALKMNPKEIFGWFAKEGLTADLTGIRFEQSLDAEFNLTGFTLFLKHFSKIVVGTNASTTDIQNKNKLPTEYGLEQNYPNPFNPTTTISYSLPKSGYTKLTIYNSIGVEIKTLVSEIKEAGIYTLSFDGSELSSGLYFYDLASNNFRSTKKMILIK